MKAYFHPEGMIAGFHAERPDPAVPELSAVGEQWAPAGRPMGWHAHDDWEFYFQIDGTTLRRDDRRTYEVTARQLFVSPPGVRHRVVNRDTGSQRNAFARFALAAVLGRHAALAPEWRLGGCVHLPGAGDVEAPLRLLVREVTLGRAFRAQAIRSALDLVVITATRLLAPSPAAQPAPALLTPEVWQAKDLLDQSSERPWTLAELARAVGLSPNHLGHLFSRHLGMPPHRYLLRQRVEQAKHLLRTSDAAVTAIALRVGFGSSQHFAKAFRAQAGMTAREYRAQAPGA
jgi:AraC-like DNA-binding protein